VFYCISLTNSYFLQSHIIIRQEHFFCFQSFCSIKLLAKNSGEKMAHPPSSSTAPKLFAPVLSREPSQATQPVNNVFQKIEEKHFTLTPIGHEHIEKFLQEKRQLKRISWSLNHLFHKLYGYFSRAFRGTKIEMTSGIFYAAGKNFWKACLEKEFQTESVEGPEVWGFCNQPPSHIEFYFCLPQKNVSKEEFTRFIDLCIYYLAMESIEPQLSDVEALREFGQISHPDPNEDATVDSVKRIKAVNRNMAEIQKVITRGLNTFEIPLSNKSSLRVVFTSSESQKNEPFSLNFISKREGGLVPELVCHSLPRQALAEIAGQRLHVAGKDRMVAYCFNDPSLRSFFDQTIDAKDIQTLTPLGLFLYQNTFLTGSNVKAATAVLTLVSLLQGYLVPAADQPIHCKHQGDQIEISWKSSS
jgi:hypothetical protein